MRLPKIRELREALGSFFSRPYTTKYPFTPFAPAPQYRGRPHYQEKDCVGCGACVQVCPAGALEMVDDLAKRTRGFSINFAHCIQCGQCQEKCTTGKGILLVNEMIPSMFQRDAEIEMMEKELVRCEGCGGTVACRDHLLWLARRLGPYAYANPSLLLAMGDHERGIPPVPLKEELRREDLYRLLCPSCRHRVVVADVFG